VEELLQEERIRYVFGDDPPHLLRVERKKERKKERASVGERIDKQETGERTSACAPSKRSGWSGASFAN
jgi:hypothetical protein